MTPSPKVLGFTERDQVIPRLPGLYPPNWPVQTVDQALVPPLSVVIYVKIFSKAYGTRFGHVCRPYGAGRDRRPPRTWSSTGPGMASVAHLNSSGVPNASRVPDTNRHGRSNRGKWSVRSCSRLARRVQRIADENERERGEAFGDRHRAHAAAHRPPAERDPLGRHAGPLGQRGRAGTHRIDQHRRPIGRLATGDRYGKSMRSTTMPCADSRFVDGDETRPGCGRPRRPA